MFEWNSLILNLEIQEMQFEVFDYQTAPEVYVVLFLFASDFMLTSLVQNSGVSQQVESRRF